MIENQHFASHVPLRDRLEFIKNIEPFSKTLFSLLLNELVSGNYISNVRRDDEGCEVVLLYPFRVSYNLAETWIRHDRSAHYGDSYFDQETGDALTSPLPSPAGK